MNFTFEWSAATSEANWTIILVTVAFLAWWLTGKSGPLLQALVRRYGPENGQAAQVLIKRCVGMVLFGLVPALILLNTQPYGWADYGVSADFPPAVFYWALGLSVIIIPMMARATRKSDNLMQYPEIRTNNWSRSLLLVSALSWMGYLFAYELMFRGFLLFSCARAFGAVPALIINTALYALVHVPKSDKEGLGAIPLGLLLCWISFQTGTIWVAVVVHWVLALSNEWFSLKHHPEMRVAAPLKQV